MVVHLNENVINTLLAAMPRKCLVKFCYGAQLNCAMVLFWAEIQGYLSGKDEIQLKPFEVFQYRLHNEISEKVLPVVKKVWHSI